MTGNVLEVQRRLSVLTDRPVSVPNGAARSARRERIAARMLEVLDEESAARDSQPRSPHLRWLAAAGGLAAAAGVALLIGSVVKPAPPDGSEALFAAARVQGTAECSQGEGTSAWTTCKPDRLGRQDRLRTQEHARADLVTPNGARLALEPNGELGLTDLNPRSTRVTLRRGRLAVRVPPLGPDGQFAVMTPSATVVVHGTAFVVEATEDGLGRNHSCVRVSEGTVSVQSGGTEQFVSAGRSLGCSDASAAESPKVAAPIAASDAAEPDARQAERALREAPRVGTSTLAIESRLLQEALGAEREGRPERAEKILVSLLRRYPNSVVVPEAAAALRRIRSRPREQ